MDEYQDSMIRAGKLGLGNWPESLYPLSKREGSVIKIWNNCIESLLPPGQNINILDAGSGNGNSFLPLAAEIASHKHPVTVTLLDIQTDAFSNLPLSLKNLKSLENLNVVPLIGSVTNIQLAASSQHGIVCESVLPWVGNETEITKALEEFHRVAASKAYLYIELMSPFNNSSINKIPGKTREERVIEVERFLLANPDRPYLYFNPIFGNKPVVYFSEKVLIDFVEVAGFKVLKSAPLKNVDFPNGLNNLEKYPDNIELLAQKL